MFIEWLMSDQSNYNLFRYGVEGENYKFDSIGIPNPIADLTVKSSAFTYSQQRWIVTNFNLDYVKKDYMDNYNKYLDEYTKYDEYTGFKLDKSQWDKLISNSGLNIFTRRDFDQKVIKGDALATDVEEYVKLQKDSSDALALQLQPLLDRWREVNER